MPNSPVVISLPNGLDLGGVTTWAVQLANGLVDRGRSVTLLCHAIPDGLTRAEVAIDARVVMADLSSLPPLHAAAGDLSDYLPAYTRVIERLAFVHNSPVIYLPNILGDSYGLGAAIAAQCPEMLRILAWQHTDSDYDSALLARYEPVITGYVAIDAHYAASLAGRLHRPASDIRVIPHGVDVSNHPPSLRPALVVNGRARQLELLYTGRIDHRQKRITALAYLGDELVARSIPHRITIVGGGPASDDLDARAATRPSIRRFSAVGAEELATFYRAADAFVLPSRYEGLCISRIEAAANGCVPIVTTRNTGATHGLKDGVSALFVEVASEADEPEAARALAGAVERLMMLDVNAMSRAAWQSAREHFSMVRHLDLVEAELDRVGASPARRWPSNVQPAFSSSGKAVEAGQSGSGSLGPNAAENVLRVLNEIATLGRGPVVLHGAGQHTIELGEVLKRSPLPIVAIADDDRERWGSTVLDWPVIDPQRVAETGATDVVISSFIHMDAVWSRRAVYERQLVNVHRVYGGPAAAAKTDYERLNAPAFTSQ